MIKVWEQVKEIVEHDLIPQASNQWYNLQFANFR